jgi:hypothetical protein
MVCSRRGRSEEALAGNPRGVPDPVNDMPPSPDARPHSPKLYPTRLPWFSLAALIVLLACAPHAASFEPFPPIYSKGLAATNLAADPRFPRRVALILLGLGATVTSLGECILLLRSGRRDGPGRASCGALFTAIFVLGWQAYPYWVNGVYQVCRRGEFTWELDPKLLPPMIWIGELWRLPVVLFIPCIALIGPALLAGGIRAVLARRGWTALTVFGCLGIATAVQVGFLPQFYEWLLD